MTRGTHTPRLRGGFTLIELLVVITIIGILLALGVGGYGRARTAALRAQAAAEIAQLSGAIGAFKVRFQVDYLPSTLNGTTFNIKRTYGKTDPEVPYLRQMFSNNLDLSDTGWTGTDPSPVSFNTALVFFLGGIDQQGFSNDKKQPFKKAVAGEARIGPFFDFPANKLSPSGEYLDPWRTPYAYFSSVKGNDYNNAKFTANSIADPPKTSKVAPFLRASRYEQQKAFQLLSAGEDRVFGSSTTDGGGDWKGANAALYAPGKEGADDLANFVNGQLGFAE